MRRSVIAAVLLAASTADAAPSSWTIAEVAAGERLVAAGASSAALPWLTHARDQALRRVGEHAPALARYDDALASALRARGRLREALRYHRESLALGETPGALVERAKTEIEGGELQAAFADLQRARQLGGDVHAVLADAAAAARDVPASLDVGPAAPRPGEVRGIPSDADPALAADVGEALLARGERARAATVLGAAVTQLGDEPTRTALRVYIELARAGNVQAARAAIAVYQALPELERGAYDEMWAITRR